MGNRLSVLNCSCTSDKARTTPTKRRKKTKFFKKLKEKANEKEQVVDELRITAGKLTPTLSHLEQDQVQTQIRDVEKRLSDIQSQAEKKSRTYQVLGTSLGDVQSEVETYLTWLKDRDTELSEQEKLKQSVSYVENRIVENKKFREDLETRQAVLLTVAKKLDDLTSDLSKPERDRIDDMIRRVQEDHQRVSQKAEQKTSWLEECLQDREIFQENLKKSFQWLVGKEKVAEKLKISRLHSSYIEKQIEKAKSLMKEVVQYEPTLELLEQQCDKVIDTLDRDSADEVIQSRRDFNIRYNDLKSTLESLSENLKESAATRKEVEADMMKVEIWCREAEVKCSGELKLDCGLEALDDQRKQYLTMKTEAENYATVITTIFERSEVFIPTLESSDATTFQQQLKSLRERHFLILTTITERWQALEASVKTRSETEKRITETDVWLTSAQDDIRRLSQPIGQSVEDAQLALQQYETLKEKLVNYRPSVANLNQSVETLRASGHVTDAEAILRITTQHEWLMDQTEQYAERCRQAVILRQQFSDQSGQINTLLTECADELKMVKESNDPVTTKLATLKILLTKIQSADPLVGVLQDKAQQIGMEGSKDHNQELNTRIVSIQTQMVELRSAVHEETLACERVQHDQEDFETEVERTVQWMEEKCQTLETRPPLELDADKIDLALKRHKVVSDDILQTLQEVRAKVEVERSRFESSGESLPEGLQQKLRDLDDKEQKILIAIESRELYLTEARSDRLQFESSLRQVTDWLHGAEDLLQSNQEGLDYETIFQQLEEHKEYFMEGSLCQDEMDQIMELSKKILPTLDKTDQTTMQQSLSKMNQKVNQAIVAGQKRQDLLEKKVSEWREYDLATQRVTTALDQLEEQWASLNTAVVRGPDDTNQQLKHSQEFLQLLEQHRTAIEELNSQTRELDRYAGADSRENMSLILNRVNERWNVLVSDVENKQGSLQDLDKEYESYKEIVATLQKHLSEVNLEGPSTDVKAMAASDLQVALQNSKDQNDKLMLIQPQIATLKKQAQSLQRKLPGAEAKVHVQERMMELIEHYERVNDKVKESEQIIQEEADDRESFQTEITQTVAWLKDTQQQLINLRPGKDTAQSQERLEKQKLMEQEVSIRMEQMRRLLSLQTTKYTSDNRELPVELRKNMETLENLQSELGVVMKEKEEELLHLREDRQEFKTLLKLATTWLEEASTQLKQPVSDLDDSKTKHNELLSEFEPFKEKLSALKEVGREISLHTSDAAEKDNTQKSFSKVSKKWFNLQRKANERTEDLQRAAGVKELIDDKLNDVQSWVENTEDSLDKPLSVTSFEDVKQKLREHKTQSKDAERYLVRLKDLSSSVQDLGKLCDASPVKARMADLSKRIQIIQSQLGDRLHLLEQANLEVLEYERDTAELYHWIDQTRAHLMVKDGGEPLKLQLEKQELLLEDIQGQKVRATTILENPPQTLGLKKLNPVDASRLLRQIDHLSQHASDQLEQLRDAVHQEEEYDREIHDLTQAIEDAQRQLQESPVTVTNVGALRQQMTEHGELAEQIRIYQARLHELNQKTKELSRRTFPIGQGLRRLSLSSLDTGVYFPMTTSSRGSSLRSLLQSGLDSSGGHDSGFPTSFNSSFMTPQLTSTSDSFWSTGRRDLSTSGLGLTTSTGNLSLRSDRSESSQLDSSDRIKPSARTLSQESYQRTKSLKVSPRSVSLDRQDPSMRIQGDTKSQYRTPAHVSSLSPSLEMLHASSSLPHHSLRRNRGASPLTATQPGQDIKTTIPMSLISASEPNLSVAGVKGLTVPSKGLSQRDLTRESKLSELNLSWNTLQQQLSAKERELQVALQKQEKYQESVQSVTEKLDDVQSKLTAPLPVTTGDLQLQMEDYKVMLTELQTVREDIARVRERGRQIMEVSDPEGYKAMQATLIMLSDRVKGLEAATEDKGKQLHSALRDREKHEIALEAYRKRVNDLEAWLAQTRQEHGGVGLPSDTADTLKYQFEENKNLQKELNTRFQQLSDLAVQCDSLCEMESAVSADRLRRDLADIQSALGELKLTTLDNHGKLKSAIKESEKREREMGEYEGSVKKLQDWISDTRRLTSAQLPATVTAQISADQEQLHQLETNLVEHRKLLKSLSQSELKVKGYKGDSEALEGRELPAVSAAELQLRWQTLSRDLEERKMLSQDTVNRESHTLSRPPILETRSLLLSSSVDPTVTQLADIHRVLHDLNNCWRHMQTEVRDKQMRLDEALEFQQRFQDALLAASTWLDSVELKLSKPQHGKTSQEELKETENILKEIKDLQQEILTVNKVSQQLLLEGSGNKVLITQSLMDLNDRVRLLESRAYRREAEISRTESRWGELRSEVQGFRKTLNDATAEFDEVIMQPSVEQQLSKNKKLEDQIVRFELELSRLEEAGTRLARLNPRMSVTTELTILRHSVEELRRRVHEKREDLRQYLAVQEQYGKMLTDYEAFLETAQEKLRPDFISAKDLGHLSQQLSAHKEFFGDLEEHRSMVDRLAFQCGPDTKEKYIVQQQRLNNLTQIVQDKAGLHSQRLGRLSRLWTELDTKILEMKDFMSMVQNQLPSPVSDEDSLETVQTKLAVYQTLQQSLNDEKSMVHEIVENGKQILHSVNCPDMEADITNLADRFVELHSNVSSELRRTETLGDQWQTFEAESAILQSWLITANGKLSSLRQLTDKDLENIGAVRTKVDKLLEFRKEVDSQLPLKNKVVTVGQQLMRSKKSESGRLHERLTTFEEQWGQLLHDIDTAADDLHQAQMELMPSRQALNELLLWLEGIEKSLRENKNIPVRCLADMEAVLKKHKDIKIDINSKQMTVEFVNETVLQLSQEALGQPSEKTEFAEKLGQLNKRWQLVNSDVTDKLKNQETLRDKWEEYEKSIKDLQDWLISQEDRIKKFQLIGNEIHVRQTLRDCKALQDALKHKEDEIESTRRLGMSLADMSRGSPGTVHGITDRVEKIHTQWSALLRKVEELQNLLNDVLSQWSEYHTELNNMTHVMNETEYSLTRLTSVSPDVHTLKVQVDKLQTLQSWFDENLPQMEKLSTLSSQLMQVCDSSVRQDLQRSLGDLKLRWNNLAVDLRKRCDRFGQCLDQWQRYEDENKRATDWLADKERQYNQLNALRDNPNERQQCLQQSKVLQADLEGFQKQLETLAKLGEEFTGNLDTPVSGPITLQQAKLTQRLARLQQSLNKHAQSVHEDITDQKRFQDNLNAVTDFLHGAESVLKQKDPDKSSDSKMVKKRLEQLKNLLGQFSTNESKIDSLNDLGYRMALSEAYSEKLLHLNHQWQNLQTDAADRYRCMQAVLLLQQDFTEKCGNWLSFLQQAEADLTKDISGNYQDLVEQQKKSETFQADIFSRQQILQAIIGDGQKMLCQGEVTDPEEFQRKLAMLSSQWQNVVKQSNHRKGVIDKAVLQWQTYHALRDRINTWLHCREQDLKTFDIENVSLQKVKDLLEKARTNLKDTSQEENYQKLNEVSQELLQRADPQAETEVRDTLNVIQHRWYQTIGRFDGQRERLEDILKQWQLCEQELEDILSWLGDLRRTLGAELPNAYDELQKDLHHCKDIEASFEKSEDRRQMLLAKERQLNSVVEAVDLSVLRERIRLLNKQWAELRHQVALRKHRIFDRLNEWSGFNEKYRDLCDWIDQMEVKVSSRTEYHVEDLLLKLQKDYRFEMDTKETAKIELVEQGRQLMKASSEVRASDINNKVAKLDDKWRHLKAVVAYRQHKLQETLLAVQQLEMSMMNLRKWLSDMEHELTSPLIYHQCDITEIQRKLQQQQELQKDIEKHSPGVASVLNLCEVLLRDSDACPTEVEYAALQQASRTLDRRWRSICQLAADRRYKIDETWRMWQQFETDNKTFTDWVKDVKLQLREPRAEHADITLVKEDGRHFESVQKKIHENLNQLENVNRQYRKMAREGRTDNAGKMKGMMQDANDQWDELSQRITDIMRRLKQPSGMKVDFETKRTTILRWLKETEIKLIELEQNSDIDIATKIAEMKIIESEIETNRKRIEYINETAVYLIGISDSSEATKLQDILDEFHRCHGDILKQVHAYQVKLKRISDGQMETIAKHSPPRATRRTIETTITQREKHTTQVDSVNWEMEELSPTNSPPEKRRATARVSPRAGAQRHTGDDTYSSVTYLTREERRRLLKEEIEIRGRLSRVDPIIEKLVESLEDAAEKLLMTERELRCGTPTGPDTDYAPGNYAELVADCEKSITLVRRYERQLKQEAGVTSMPSVDAQVDSVIQRWENLHARAVEKDIRLSQNRDDWVQFQMDLNLMMTWLGEAEAFLENESLSSTGEMTLLESVVRRHKDFLLQLDSKRKVVMSLNLSGKNFVYNKSDESRQVRERLRIMNKRWESVCTQANVLHRDLQLGLAHSEEFQKMIHDLLMWLEKVESKLQQIEPISLAADHTVLRAKYRRLLDLKDDMEDHHPEVVALKETADQLLLTTDSPDMAMARDKTRIIANRLRSLMKRCLTYIRQLEHTLGLTTRASSAKYDYLDSQDQGLGSSRRSSPRSSPYRPRPRSALAYTSQLLFGSRSEEAQLDSDTTTQDEVDTVRRRRPAFLARVLRTALPLQILMLALLGLACLVPVCEDEEYGCMFMNNMERSWTPMLRYTDGPPPT